MMQKIKSLVVIAIAILSLPLFGGVYVKFDAKGGTFAVPGVTMESGSIPDEVMTEKGYADPVRIGYNFAGWSSIAEPKDDAELDQGFAGYYATPVTKATTFYAIWERYEPHHYDDNGVWELMENGISCVGTNGESTTCSYDVPGRGWVSFKWRTVLAVDETRLVESSGYGYNYLQFGFEVVEGDWRTTEDIPADGGWQTVRMDIGNADRFFLTVGGPVDCCSIELFLDPRIKVEITDITWESADDLVTEVTFEPCGGTFIASGQIGGNGVFNAGMDSNGVFWYDDQAVLTDAVVDRSSSPQYQWTQDAAERFPHLQWICGTSYGGVHYPKLRQTSSLLNADEVTLLVRIADVYRYRSGGVWCLSISYIDVDSQTLTDPPPTNVLKRTGYYGDLPIPVREGCSFLGWATSGQSVSGSVPSGLIGSATPLPLSSNVTVYAAWDVPKEVAADPEATIDGGIEFAEGSWGVYNQWDYVIDYDDQGQWIGSHEVWGGEYLHWSRSMTISQYWNDKFDFRSDKNIPVLSANVTGCGVYHFQELYCRNSDLQMLVLVDGEVRHEVPQYSSNPVDIEIRNGGEHVVEVVLRLREWRNQDYDSQTGSYYMSVHGYADIGAMNWWRAPAQLDVNFDVHGGRLDGPSVCSYETGVPYGTLPKASRDGFEFLGWFTEPDGGDCVSSSELVRVAATNLHARWSTDLKTAIGGGKLRFASRDDWIGSTDYYHGDKGVSAGTAELVWGETNVMTTVVQGRGILSFWWMQGEDVSVMDDASLTLWLDGNLMATIRGTAKWQHMTLPVLGKGNHIVEWKYTPGTWDLLFGQLLGVEWNDPLGMWQATLADWKSYSARYPEWAGARPCRPGAWVDEVGWMPGGEVKDIVTWVKGIAEGHAWLTDELPLIEAEYTKRIAEEPQNYEWLILRAFTKLCRLGENENLKAVLARFGFAPDYQVLGRFFGELDYYDAPLSNEVVDSLAAEAVPTIESALADLELIPANWDGSISLSPEIYPVDSVTYVDLADVTLCKAALKGALSALAIAEGYDLSVDYMNGEMEEILAEAGLLVTFEYLVEDHPEFAKRVRDAERLGEGKEILRDALETFQVFDELMLGRTTSEMHFFEYDEKDADKQQYAREEVAKMLVALDGETVISNDDFRYAPNFTVSEMNQPATLVPFFNGNVTRRYLPTEIHDNHPVFDSFPTMSFGGTFPGLTKDTVAGWLAENGREVEYTPNSDYEPEVQFRTFNAAIPNLGASATEEEIEDALAGTADAKVKANITDAKSYAAYENWATKIQSAGVPLKAVKASPCSWQSFALAAPELMQDEITDEDLTVEEFKPSSESGKFDFTVSVKDVTVGSEAVEENLKQVIGLEGAESLGEVFKSENVAIKFGQPEDGKLKFTAEPKNAEAKSFFMKMKVK